MLRLTELRLPLDHLPEDLPPAICAALAIDPARLERWALVKRGNDARRKSAIKLVYAVDVTVTDETEVLARLAGNPNLRETPDTTYRFPTQEDLVIAGLEYIITHLLTDVGETEASGSGQLVAPDPMEGLDVGRATFSVALAAIRIPRLVPCAADMRRNRGINLVRLLKSRSPDYARMDRLSAQTLAVGIVGATLFVPVREASVERTESLVEPARRWMIGASQRP